MKVKNIKICIREKVQNDKEFRTKLINFKKLDTDDMSNNEFMEIVSNEIDEQCMKTMFNYEDNVSGYGLCNEIYEDINAEGDSGCKTCVKYCIEYALTQIKQIKNKE